jgi:cation:H+ antiporter
MSMTAVVLQFLASAAVIVVAGTFLARYGDAIADLTGLGRLLVGSVLVAGATSLPELSVDLNAIRLGAPDLAIGDLMGSCLCNLMIHGGVDMVHRSRRKMFSRESAAHALSATVSVALVSLAALGILLAAKLPGEFLGLGVGTWMVLAGYVGGVRLVYIDQRISAIGAAEAPQDVLQPAGKMTLRRAALGFAAAAAVIVAAGPFLAESAETLAELTGLGTTFVGSTMVALSTSLPELVATIAAVRMGAPDLAIGSVFGSNAFNMVLIAPLDLAHDGALLAAVTRTHVVTAIWVILVSAVAVMGQIYNAESRKRLIEPDAMMVTTLVIAAMTSLYYLR